MSSKRYFGVFSIKKLKKDEFKTVCMQRGRPTKSVIRQNVVNYLFTFGSTTGYDLAKKYDTYFPKCTMRSVYYHLQKGLTTGEIIIKEVKDEAGEFSWGNTVRKVYYDIGPEAHPQKVEKPISSDEAVKQ